MRAKKHMRAKIFEYKDQKIRRRTQKTFFYGPNNMEPLNIPGLGKPANFSGLT